MHLGVRTMDDLISREVAAKILRARAEMATGTPKSVFYAAAGMIDRLPAVDAEPVQHGNWIEPDDRDGITACICSICDWHGHIMEDDVMGMNYCPNCGAKMSEVGLVDGNN